MQKRVTFPLIQLALDFTEIKRACAVAEEAVSAGINWIEAGTPLIKSEGLFVIRTLRQKFPSATLIADMKVMDAGRMEAEIAFKSGADIVTVMGNASDETIKEVVEAANNYGGMVIVDLLEESLTPERAKKAEQMGAQYISVHIPIDKQMAGDISFEPLRKIVSAVKIPVAVAGGLHSENIVQALKAGASIFIVGGAITKSEDIASAVGSLQKAVATKKAIKTDLYKRAGVRDVLQVLSNVSTSNITDALHRKGWLKSLYPVLSVPFKMAGPAVTVRTYPGDWAKPVEAIDAAQKGDIIVIDAGGVGPAVWGELATNSCLIQKVGGVVIYGGIRDVQEIRDMGFPAFATLICPEAGEPKGLGEINIPIRVSGYSIAPGDWIVGDTDGVVVVPRDRISDVANRAMDVLERENRIRKEIKDGGTLNSVAELLKWEKPR